MTQNTLEVIGFLAACRRQGRGATAREIADETGVARSTAYRILRVLVADKLARKQGTIFTWDCQNWLASLIVEANNRWYT